MIVIVVAGRTTRSWIGSLYLRRRDEALRGRRASSKTGYATADGAGWEAFRCNPWHERTIGCYHGGVPHPAWVPWHPREGHRLQRRET